MTQREMSKAFPIPALPVFFATWLSRTSWQTKQPKALRRFGASPLLPDGAGQGEERLRAR